MAALVTNNAENNNFRISIVSSLGSGCSCSRCFWTPSKCKTFCGRCGDERRSYLLLDIDEDMIVADLVTYNAEYHYFRIPIVSSNTTSVSETASYQNIWEVETVLNFKYSSPTVSDLPDIPMHILNSPTIISCSLILRRSSCKVHRFSSRFWFSLSFLL